ncbi:hypothetical protein NQZ68_010286 [Dissostichus eleginoides]|nr:hypothetical protein NQZ68_010286 [Dissostichus eleginoides]
MWRIRVVLKAEFQTITGLLLSASPRTPLKYDSSPGQRSAGKVIACGSLSQAAVPLPASYRSPSTWANSNLTTETKQHIEQRR